LNLVDIFLDSQNVLVSSSLFWSSWTMLFCGQNAVPLWLIKKKPQHCCCWLPRSREGVKLQTKTGNISKYITVYNALSVLHWQANQLSQIIWYIMITSVKTM
jgi:hypothetical protein